MGKAYDKEMIPTEVQRLERQYPAYALSTPRLRVVGARITARAGSLATLIHEQDPMDIHEILDMVERVLLRIVKEGEQPVYDAMLTDHPDPFWIPQVKFRVPTHPLTMRGPR